MTAGVSARFTANLATLGSWKDTMQDQDVRDERLRRSATLRGLSLHARADSARIITRCRRLSAEITRNRQDADEARARAARSGLFS